MSSITITGNPRTGVDVDGDTFEVLTDELHALDGHPRCGRDVGLTNVDLLDTGADDSMRIPKSSVNSRTKRVGRSSATSARPWPQCASAGFEVKVHVGGVGGVIPGSHALERRLLADVEPRIGFGGQVHFARKVSHERR